MGADGGRAVPPAHLKSLQDFPPSQGADTLSMHKAIETAMRKMESAARKQQLSPEAAWTRAAAFMRRHGSAQDTAQTKVTMSAPGTPPAENMVWVPGGTFLMGSDHHYPEEAPAHRVSVDGFWMDRTPVTNEQFARFVEATGHMTFAEIAAEPGRLSRALARDAAAGSLVFVRPPGPWICRTTSQLVALHARRRLAPPAGPGELDRGPGQHPVVHVAFADAEAYARWAGKELPTEAEWESRRAAASTARSIAWGDEFTPGGRLMANTWQGEFPWQNLLEDGYERTSPVGAFPANGYGLYDMIGNVWEWTTDWYRPRHPDEA